MPIFSFKKDKKAKNVPKKASSMNNIYNDYGGNVKLAQKADIEEFVEENQHCFRGNSESGN